MTGDKKVIQYLNKALTVELTAINPYSCMRACTRTGVSRPPASTSTKNPS